METDSRPDTPDDLVDTKVALRLLKRSSPKTISRLVKAGKLTPAVKAPGIRGAYMFRRGDVEELALSKFDAELLRRVREARAGNVVTVDLDALDAEIDAAMGEAS